MMIKEEERKVKKKGTFNFETGKSTPKKMWEAFDVRGEKGCM